MAEETEAVAVVNQEPNKYACDKCGALKVSPTSLWLISHNPDSNKWYCTLCMRIFFSQNGYDLNKVKALFLQKVVRIITYWVLNPKYESDIDYWRLVKREPYKSLVSVARGCKKEEVIPNEKVE